MGAKLYPFGSLIASLRGDSLWPLFLVRPVTTSIFTGTKILLLGEFELKSHKMAFLDQ